MAQAATSGPRPILTDFGLAKNTVTGSRYTRTGETLGTPAYMSPEQARGEFEALTPAGDVWALGCVLYELLAGRPAFRGDSPAAVIGAVLTTEPERLRGVPPQADRLLRACLAKRPGARPATAGAVRDDCARVLQGTAPVSRAPARRAIRGWIVAAVMVVAAAGAAVVAARRPEGLGHGLTPLPSKAAVLAERAWDLRAAQPDAAADLLAQALALEPNRGDWRVRRGLLLWSTQRVAEAHREWDRVPASDPSWGASRWYTGFELICRSIERRSSGLLPPARAALADAARAGAPWSRLAGVALRFAGGERPLPSALDGLPGWDAQLLRGLLSFQPGSAESARAAVRAYGAALQQGMPFAWALNNRGLALATLGDQGGALADYDAALRLSPRYASPMMNRALCRFAQGDTEGALADYATALEWVPEHAPAYYNRGLAWVELGRMDAARDDFTKAIELAPDWPAPYRNRARARAGLGDSAGALVDANAALDLEPDHLEGLILRGVLHRELGNLRQALADYQAVLDRDPDYLEGLLGRAVVLQNLGQIELGARDVDRALALHPDHPRGLAARAGVKLRRGDAVGALADADAALRLDPACHMAYAQRAFARQQSGDLRGALADYDAALDLTPYNHELRVNRAVVCAALGDRDAAVAELAELVRLAPRLTQAWGALGQMRFERREWADAAAALREFLRRVPNHPRAASARLQLAECERQLAAGAGR